MKKSAMKTKQTKSNILQRSRKMDFKIFSDNKMKRDKLRVSENHMHLRSDVRKDPEMI